MRKSLRQRTTVLLVAGALVALASPALSAPSERAAQAPGLTSPQPFAGLLAWLGQWLDGEPLQGFAAFGNSTIDSADEPTAPNGPDPGDGPTVSEEGGPTMDPDG